MNKNQVKGASKDVAGKIQVEAGKLVGSKGQQIKGLSKQISGKAQKGLGDIEQAIEDSTKGKS
ncbi:MAG: CsbD family protein [Burkholderiales bacterium]